MYVTARVRNDQIQRKQQSVVGAILPEANPQALMNKYMRVYLRCAGAFNARLQRQSMQLAVMDDALNYTCKESSPLYIKICVGHDVFFVRTFESSVN